VARRSEHLRVEADTRGLEEDLSPDLAGVGEVRRAIEATLDAPLDRIVAWRQLTPGG